MAVSSYKFGDFEVDRSRFQLRRNGAALKLEPIPLELLLLLVERDGNVVTRQEIAERLWGKDVFLDTDHGINTAVRKVRQALGEDPEKPRFVETVSGRGYRFAAPTIGVESTNGNGSRILHPASSEGAPAPVLPEVSAQTTVAPPAIAERPRARWLLSSFIVACAILLLWLIRPTVPAPKILRTTQLTSDGREKFAHPVTDGLRLYLTERIGEHWTVVALPVSGGEATPVPLPFPESQVLDVSPDHAALLLKDAGPGVEHALWRVPILVGAPRRLGNIEAHDAVWSPDGHHLAYVNGPDLYLAKSDASEPHQVELPNSKSNVWAWSPKWSPDGNRIRFERYTMDTHMSSLWEASGTGENPHQLFPQWQKVPMQCCGTWTTDGKYYVFDAWEELEGGAPLAPAPDLWAIREQPNLLRRVSPKPVQLTTGPTHFFTHLFSGDGKRIIALSTQRRGELARYDSKVGKFSPYLAGFSAAGVNFSSDGKWMAYVKFPQGELWRSRADGTEALQLTFRPLMVNAPRWSPDGTQIVFTGQKPGAKLQIYSVRPDGSSMHPLSITTGLEGGADWSPDGSVVFADVSRGMLEIGILDLKTRQSSVLPGSAGMTNASWSRDGQHVCATIDARGALVVFDVRSQQWTTFVASGVDDAVWSKSGEFIYYITTGQDRGIFRVGLKNTSLQKIASLKGLQLVDMRGPVLSLTPDDEPLILRETGSETEIYALDWDAP